MGIQSIIHTSYFIIHPAGFPDALTPPPILLTPYSVLPKHEPHEHLPDIKGMSFCPSHSLSDESLQGGGAFRGRLDVGGVDDFVSLFIELEGKLKVFGDGGPPAEPVKKVPADHVDRTGYLLHSSVEFGS